MSQIFKPLGLLIIFLSFVVSCTDSPKNDGDSKASPVIPDVNPGGIPKANEILKNSPIVFSNPGELDGIGSVEEQELKKKNLNEPIIYGVGAAGITMDTTFEESKTLLTPPFRGPFSNGVTFYNEQIITVWQNEGERKPRIIYVSKGYLGKMSVGDAGKFKDLDFQSKFPEYKNGKDPIVGAQKLIREFYLEFEQTQDKSYDCLSAGRCTLVFGDANQPNMVLVLPGAVFLFAKEEFQLAEIRIIRDIDPGMLANNLDLLTGDILVPEESPLNLGQSYKQIFDRLEASPVNSSPEVYVSTDTMGYSWKGFWYSFHRSNYDIDAIKAEPTDVTKAVQVSSDFPAYLTVNGARVLVTQSLADVSFSLETMPDPETMDMDDVALNEKEVESKLKMTTLIKKQNALKFSQNFTKFLESELKQKYDVVVSRVSGFQNEEKSNKEIVSIITAYNSSDFKGVRIAFEVKEEQEKLGFFVVSSLDNKINAFNPITLPSMQGDVVREMELKEVLNEVTQLPLIDPATKTVKTVMTKSDEFTKLAGFKLNDLVRLTEIDALGRGEATVEYLSSGNGNPIIERAEYIEQGSFNVIDENRPAPRNQSYVTVGLSGTVLGLINVGEDEKGLLARVVSISSSDIYGKIQDVCELGDAINFEVGMKVKAAETSLLNSINASTKKDADYKCNHIKVRDDGGKNFLKTVYFPNERLIIDFNDKALSSATIYLPLSQVQPLEVNQ